VTLGGLRMTRGGRRAAVVSFGLYALVILWSPVLHHDFACHLKSPTHCTACTASPAAPRIEQSPTLLVRLPLTAQRTQALAEKSAAKVSLPRLPGRSPPV
jgi:hypothetical protein